MVNKVQYMRLCLLEEYQDNIRFLPKSIDQHFSSDGLNCNFFNQCLQYVYVRNDLFFINPKKKSTSL